MRNLILFSLLALPLSGCAVVGVATGIVVSSQMMDNNIYTSHINKDSAEVWSTVKTFLSSESKELIKWNDETRVATATIDDAEVTVTVETWDLGKSVLSVRAKRYMATVNDGELAKIIMERLQRRLEN